MTWIVLAQVNPTPFTKALLRLNVSEVRAHLEGRRGEAPSLAQRSEAINDLASSFRSFEKPGPATEIVKMLVAKGVDFDRSKTKGLVPLNYVARSQNPGLVKLLLDLGADPNVREPNTVAATPLWSSLVTGGDYTLRVVHATAAERQGLDPSAGKSAPQYANLLRRTVAVLLDGGADPMSEAHGDTSWYTTPFHRACYWGEAEMVRHMLRKGAKPNARQGASSRSYDWTPLHVCALRNGPENVKTAKILIEAGADPGSKDSQGMTLRDLALKKGNSRVAAALK
ncbi:MAG: ankyrin repeat domain-containing protein [Fimbriimonadaceae bacterium]|nr:ankyrin repeat domain-containing protein [Fimbriimonadaceae bacterium]